MNRARVVVFPIKGRTWCFALSIDACVSNSSSSSSPSLRDLWKKLSSNDKPVAANAELVVDFVSDKMNKAWTGFEKAPEGSFKNKIHGYGWYSCPRVALLESGPCPWLPWENHDFPRRKKLGFRRLLEYVDVARSGFLSDKLDHPSIGACNFY
ncbi:hypothetical protein AKJ16_DCAP25111 [Drosera capensis]